MIKEFYFRFFKSYFVEFNFSGQKPQNLRSKTLPEESNEETFSLRDRMLRNANRKLRTENIDLKYSNNKFSKENLQMTWDLEILKHQKV